MNKILGFSVGALVASIAILVAGNQRLASVEADLAKANVLAKEISVATEAAKTEIESSAREIEQVFAEELSKIITEKGDILKKSHLSSLEAEHHKLVAQIAKRESELEQINEEADRKRKNLPSLVELDDLKTKYSKASSSGYGHAVKFDTDNGVIGFSRSQISMFSIPSSGELARVRIGKTATTENAELIKDWILDSREAKKTLGYDLIYKRAKPSDYGQYTEALMKKGDLYFKTYYQYERVSGTYGSHSLQYTYYVETGSTSRLKRAKLEQANAGLGS